MTKNRKLLLVTSNAHKVEEFQVLLAKANIKREVLSLKDIGYHQEIVENGVTFSENAWIKVNALNGIWKEDILADDSGFEVHVLNGRPGVYSARYAGVPVNHAENMAKVLHEMEHQLDRRAHFKTYLAGYWEGKPFEVMGAVEGFVLRHPQGWGGFGYDPIFVPRHVSRSFAQLSIDEKNILSHRGIAFSNWISWIRKGGM